MFADDDINSEMPSSERISSVIMETFLGKGHVLFTDNYYASPTLLKYLIAYKTHLCGTARSNRYNYPKEIVDEVLEKGDAVFYEIQDDDSPMVACKYRATKDKSSGQQKVVYMLSTCHHPSMGNVENGRSEIPVVKPVAVKQYNIQMGGVDRVDQQLQSFKILRKTYKWYCKLASRLISQSVLNSHNVFLNFFQRNDLTFLQFMHGNIRLLLLCSPKLKNRVASR